MIASDLSFLKMNPLQSPRIGTASGEADMISTPFAYNEFHAFLKVLRVDQFLFVRQLFCTATLVSLDI